MRLHKQVYYYYYYYIVISCHRACCCASVYNERFARNVSLTYKMHSSRNIIYIL